MPRRGKDLWEDLWENSGRNWIKYKNLSVMYETQTE